MRSLPVVRGVSRTSTFPGPRRLALCTLLVVAGLGVFVDDASAQRRNRPWRADEAKFDALLREMAPEDDDLPVIVEFNDDRNADEAISSHGRRSERRLSSMRGRSTRMSKRLLRQLARRGDVKRVHFDRPVEALLGRSSITVGAKTVQALMGFDGKGIGVAVIDSGVTPSHDDLRYAGSTTQRVTKFVDFVNGQTARYDDWGHGTHVAGIIAGNGYDSHGTRRPASPPGRRWSPSRRSTARAAAGSATSSRRSTGRWPTAPPTTSASSTCRSARACSSPTTPTR